VYRPLACLVLVLAAGLLAAAGLPAGRTPAGSAAGQKLRVESQNYAVGLLPIAIEISQRYVRPVKLARLLGPAVRGLYQAAQVRVPAGLDADLEAAEKKALAANDTQPLVDVLARCREGAGDVEPVRGPNGLLVSCEAMIRGLDPYSAVVHGEALRRGNGVDDQRGVGIELADNFGAGPLVIKTVVPGGPAQVAGLRPGDEITHLNGKPANRMDWETMPAYVQSFTQFQADSLPVAIPVKLTVRRPGARTSRKVTLEPQEWRPETLLGVMRDRHNRWDYFLDRPAGIAHIRLAAIGTSTALQMRETVTDLRGAGMRGLILDLRWSPGGYLQEAVNLASLFVGEGMVATVKHRDGHVDTFPSTAENKFLDFPVVVLINGETSGGAELIAAALQDHKRAAVVGQRTLGKASVQSMLPLGIANAGLKLTTATFLRPSGKNLHRFPDSRLSDDWGVRPDPKLDCRVSPALARQLRAWWELQSLRPGTSDEVLPLDDPDSDPQRAVAVQTLRRMLK
jgi:carboxyl-terminal processing protease